MVHAPPRPPAGAPPVRINLYSDTQTRPTPAMLEAMTRAEVGDDQSGNDPTINALCDRMASLLGKEAAIAIPPMLAAAWLLDPPRRRAWLAATVASIQMPHLPCWNSERVSLNPFEDAPGGP